MGGGKKKGSPWLEVQMSQMQNKNQAMQTSSICQPAVPVPHMSCMPYTGHVFPRSFGQLLPTVPIPYMESYALYRSCVFQVLWPAGTHCTNSIYRVLYSVHVMCFLQVLWPAGTHCTNSTYGVLYPVHVMCFPGPLASYLITKTTHRKVALLGSVMVVLGMLLMPFLPYIPALCISFGVLSGNHHLSNVNQSYHVACCSVGGWVCLLVCAMLYHIVVVVVVVAVEGNQSENGSWSKM